MRTDFSTSGLIGVGVLLMALAAPTLVHAQAFQVNCGRGGDAMGHAVATNGDFNGDGVNDIAIGSPCFYSRTFARAGRVIILDGRSGKIIFRKNGGRIGQWMGASVSFLPDLNGDDRDEIAFGSPGYDVSGYEQGDATAGTKESAGRVDVYQRNKRRMRVFGVNRNSGFGERIAPTSDIDNDGRRDFLISASTDSMPGGRSKPGRVWLVSGRNGDLLSYRVGPKAGKNYGRALSSTADYDGDGLAEFLAGSDELNLPNVLNAGAIDVVSSADMQGDPLLQVTGARSDRLGRTVDYAGDVDHDDIDEFIVGAFKADDNEIKDAGLVTLFNMNGVRRWVRQDPSPQEKAYFGDSVATVGDINGDGFTDFVVGAPGYDVGGVDEIKRPDAGRIVTLSGEDGKPIWSRNGENIDDEFGYALAGKIDFNLDGTPDIVVGAPGGDPYGRRGAGSVKILSGIDGKQLLLTGGRRGLDTRMVSVTPSSTSSAHLRSWNSQSEGQILNTEVLIGVKVGELDVNVLNDRNIPRPQVVQAAVSAGHGSNKSTVEVYQMGNRSKKVDSFEAFPGANFGVECAAGQIDGEPFEELVCAQASSSDGNVMVRVFRRLDEQQAFFIIDEFPVFASTDMLSPPFLPFPINADGANVAIGDVTGGSEEEIIVGTNRGVPLVKIFSPKGVFIRSFLAYEPVSSSGVDVATMSASGAGEDRILTAPREGEALIKLFAGSGERVLSGHDNIPVGVSVRPLPYRGGARVAAADLDYDDKQEMLVFVPSPVGRQVLEAYELANNPVLNFEPFNPSFNQALAGGAIAGTDRFVRD